MFQYSNKTNTYIIPFTGYVEIHASTEEEAEKIFQKRIFGKEHFPSSYSITYEEVEEV